ncbi:hypothetical protein GQ55_7G087400 [Panicum hallii var. hallii]|uniref:GB1/RHD3-type G domain-containing protein n=2 Tax=Panicum hallii var. hallii TaxID=1504633 RepID=A0A2T7CT87_9POAL|nr:hypothetical protein GQ55_7G087400 [Panicum hallii var. hallii]PUZ46541.1 hypothetical protein GQ55_7G087400 [Panicum hallii var. hallii]PUZ46542.1 hypothetical protein GQ55_7G087400 [Panicum hallii var. hallii]PUZ46543.1 hypothetical protein GQ55_7G087400 [Panicum hallii var. hallii]PUZ46544.1 hypothetical protein GQ55_7G087400 [Panicum hallii var. hallii]
MEKEQNKSMYADLGHFSQSSIQDVANCIRPLRFHHKSQMGGACFSTQLIDGDGVFNVSKLENFMKEVRLGECRLSYAVVSIMGPQSSGKSTLLNHLFGPNVRETDAFKGRSQTTKGIWLALAKAKNIEPCTLVMDLEGTDGREGRGGEPGDWVECNCEKHQRGT